MKSVFSGARLSALTLAASAAFPLIAMAQTAVYLPEMVVTATRSPQLLSATLAHTTLISREDIERSQAVDLVTLLDREAGLQRTQTGGTGSTSTVFLRGAPSLQTLILIDGVAQNKQDASGAVSLEHVMLDNVERVEIVRGNVSAIYGSGAIGGVIQIFTRSGNRGNSASMALEAGPRATTKLSANAMLTLDQTSIQVGASRFKTDGFSTVNTQQLPSANPDNDGYQNTSSHVAVTHLVAKGHQLGLKLSQSQGETAFDNYFGAPADQQWSTTTLNQASVFSANQWGAWNSRITLSQSSDTSVNRDNGTYGSIDHYKTQSNVLSWVNTLGVNDAITVMAGMEQQRQAVDTSSSSLYSDPYSQSRTARALFVGLDGLWGDASVQVNARNDAVGDLSKATAYLGLGYAMSPQFRATLSTSTAFNAPPLGYLFAPGYGNPLLKPEVAASDEVGLQYALAGHLLRATYFDTRVDDQLTYDTITFAFANVKRTKNSGVELTYRATVGATEWRASVTDQNPVDATTGERLVRRARQMASLGLSHGLGAWQVGANLRWSGERNDAYSNPATFSTEKTTLDAYTVIDLNVAYRWSPTVRLTARVDNLGDASYQTVYGYVQQPRSLYAGLTWTPAR